MPTRTRRRYPSDLSEHQWSQLEPLLPFDEHQTRLRRVSLRDVADAINYRWETGCAWRMLPHDFPAWGTVYAYFRAWQQAGVIREFRDLMIERPPRPVRQSTGSTGSFELPQRRTAPAAGPAHEHGFSSPDRGPAGATERSGAALPR